MDAPAATQTSAITQAARWASQVSYRDIPADVLAVARNCFIDTLGVAIAAIPTPVAAHARAYVAENGALGAATVLGGTQRLRASAAAFANAACAHALDFDDNCYSGFVHGSAVLVPAALATAESQDASGADLLTAFVTGAEVEFACGDAATAHIYEKGWWTTGVLGPIGASATGAKLLGLDATRTGHALGLAVAGTGGAKACFGTDAKPMLCGRASEAGLVAAMLAKLGVTGPRDAFEDSRGFAHLLNDGIFDCAPFAELGRTWRLRRPGIDVKRIPVCLSAHAAVDAVNDLVAEHGLARETIMRVTCDVTPVVAANLVYGAPTNAREAQFSLPFAIGCTLLFGDVTLECLETSVLSDPRLRDAMSRVEMVMTDRWNATPDFCRRYPEGAFVTVTTADGRRLEHFNGFARGTTARPLSQAEVEAKFMTCSARVIGDSQGRALLARLQAVDSLPNAREVLAPISWP